jgi:hypothetical protein
MAHAGLASSVTQVMQPQWGIASPSKFPSRRVNKTGTGDDDPTAPHPHKCFGSPQS